MTERCEHGDGYFPPQERQNLPTALWLTAIPMVVASAIGLMGGHALPSKERNALAQRPFGISNALVDRAARELTARPPEAMAGRSFATTSSHFAPSTTSSTTPLTSAPTRVVATAPATAPAPVVAPVSHPQNASGCAAALQWLFTHSAPGFRFECPGNALGHQGMTCVDVANVCPGERLIAIADACPAAYMNEAHNSWILTGLASGRLDPYGYCD